jgi:transcriptional regulator with XRE-family HTH domain
VQTGRWLAVDGRDTEIEEQIRRFGQRLRLRRSEAGLSQLALAERAGVDLAAVSFLERAKRAPNLNTLVRVARAAGVSPAMLLEDDAQGVRPHLAGAGDGDPLKRFGANLRQVRNTAGISQETLAHDARLDRAAISIIERGTRAANLRTILKLARALNIAPAHLLAGID